MVGYGTRKIGNSGQGRNSNRRFSWRCATYCTEALGLVEGLRKFTLSVMALSLMFWLVAWPYIVSKLIPSNYFMTDVILVVEDTVEGRTPRIMVDRRIIRDFEAYYRSNVRRNGPTGPLVTGCEGVIGPIHSVAGSEPPANMTLDRWLGYPHWCELLPGKYVMVSEVFIEAPWWGFGAQIVVPVVTNLFTVEAIR